MNENECPVCGEEIDDNVLGKADDIGETNFADCPECGTPLTVTVLNGNVVKVVITGK
jgi:uncharacterized Zn finger protein